MGIYVKDVRITESIAKLLTVASGQDLVFEDGYYYAEPVGSVSKKDLLFFLTSSVAGNHFREYPLSKDEEILLFSFLNMREIVWS